MKAILITYDQAHFERILSLLDHLNCRGFTSLGTVQGRGSKDGEPHYGSHAWPTLNEAIITVVPDDKAPELLKSLKDIDNERPKLGLRAFQWEITDSI